MELNELSLEDIAMGKRPTKVMGEKAEKVSPIVDTEIKKLAGIIADAEGKSIKSFKALNLTELKMLLKTYDAIQDTMYRLKEMTREAVKPLAPKGNGKMAISMVGYDD